MLVGLGQRDTTQATYPGNIVERPAARDTLHTMQIAMQSIIQGKNTVSYGNTACMRMKRKTRSFAKTVCNS